jgi:hypothetical protein
MKMKLPKMNKFHVFLMLLFFLVFALLAKNVWDYYMSSWGLKEGFSSSGTSTSRTEVKQYNNDGKRVYSIMDSGDSYTGTDVAKALYFDPDNGNVFYVDTPNKQVKIHSREYGSLNTITVSGELDTGKSLTPSLNNMSSFYNNGWLKQLDLDITKKPYVAYIPFGNNTLVHVFDVSNHILTRYFDNNGNMYPSNPSDPEDYGVAVSDVESNSNSNSNSNIKTFTITNATAATIGTTTLTASGFAVGNKIVVSSVTPSTVTITPSYDSATSTITLTGNAAWTSATITESTDSSAFVITSSETFTTIRQAFTNYREGFSTNNASTLATVKVNLYPNEVYRIASGVYLDLSNSYLVLDNNVGTTRAFDNTGEVIDLNEASLSGVTRTRTNAWVKNGLPNQDGTVDHFVVYMDNGRKTIVAKIKKTDAGDFAIDTIKRIEDGVLKTSDDDVDSGNDVDGDDDDSDSSNQVTSGSNDGKCKTNQLEMTIAGATLCVPITQVFSIFGGGGSSPGSNFIRKTEVVPPVCPQCPQCPSHKNGVCTNCGGNGGSGTSSKNEDGSLLRDAGSGATNLVRDGATGATNLARDGVSGAANMATNTVQGTVNLGKDAVQGTVGMGKDAVQGTVGMGKDIVGGIGSGIGSVASGIGNMAQGITQTNPAIVQGQQGVNQAYGSNQIAYQNSYAGNSQQQQQHPGMDPYSYYGAVPQRPSCNFMARTADFSAFGK